MPSGFPFWFLLSSTAATRVPVLAVHINPRWYCTDHPRSTILATCSQMSFAPILSSCRPLIFIIAVLKLQARAMFQLSKTLGSVGFARYWRVVLLLPFSRIDWSWKTKLRDLDVLSVSTSHSWNSQWALESINHCLHSTQSNCTRPYLYSDIATANTSTIYALERRLSSANVSRLDNRYW